MLCVCVVDVMDVGFSVCIVRRGAVGARVCVSVSPSDVVCLYASCGSSQCRVLHDMHFVNAG